MKKRIELSEIGDVLQETIVCNTYLIDSYWNTFNKLFDNTFMFGRLFLVFMFLLSFSVGIPAHKSKVNNTDFKDNFSLFNDLIIEVLIVKVIKSHNCLIL